jgi:hypothetical protein
MASIRKRYPSCSTSYGTSPDFLFDIPASRLSLQTNICMNRIQRYLFLALVAIPERINPTRVSDFAIVVNFPEKPIKIPHYRSFWNHCARLMDGNRDHHVMVGHTGVILVDGASGRLTYYDFGRYDDRDDLNGPRPEFYGTVRSERHVRQLELPLPARLENGRITNLDTILIHLGAKKLFRTYGRIDAAVVYQVDIQKMNRYASECEEQDYYWYGAPAYQYCTRFVREVVCAGGYRFPPGIFTGKQTIRQIKRDWPD